MINRSRNELSALTAGILGLYGISLLLTPSRMLSEFAGFPFWIEFPVGILGFILALFTLQELTASL